MKFSRHNHRQQEKNLNDNAQFKLYKAKTRWLVSKRVLGVTFVAAALGVGIGMSNSGTVHASDETTAVAQQTSRTTATSTDSNTPEAGQPSETPATHTPGAATPEPESQVTETPTDGQEDTTGAGTTENNVDTTLKGDGSESSATPVAAARTVSATDATTSAQYFTPSASTVKNDGTTLTSDAPTTAADETAGSFTLTQDGIKDQAGNVIFNNDVDMSQSWQLKGAFKFSKNDDVTADATDVEADNDSDWGKGYSGWQLGDGAGIVISSATQAELAQGGAGNAFGIGGIGNSIAAVLDTYYNTKPETEQAPNGVSYTQVADEPVSTANGTDNDPGTLEIIGQRWIDEAQQPVNGVGLDITGQGDNQETSAGGSAIRNQGLSQAVIKFVTTNADGSVVTPDEASAKAYSPSSAVGSSTTANAAGERFVATWTPDITSLDKSAGTVSGTLTITWYGNDDAAYQGGFTISKTFTASVDSTIGLISSNGEQTATTVATIDSFTASVKSQLVTIDYAINGDTGDSLQASNATVNIGDTVTVSAEGSIVGDVNLTVPTVPGYHVANITVNGQTSNTDTVILTVSRSSAANTVLVTYVPNSTVTDVQVPVTLTETDGQTTAGQSLEIDDVPGTFGQAVTISGIPTTYTDANGTIYTTTQTTAAGTVNADGSITVATPIIYVAKGMVMTTISYLDTTTNQVVASIQVSGQEGTTTTYPFTDDADGTTYTAPDGKTYALAPGQSSGQSIVFIAGATPDVTVKLVEMTHEETGTLALHPLIQVTTNGDPDTLSGNVVTNADTGTLSFSDQKNQTTGTTTWQAGDVTYLINKDLLPSAANYDYDNATVTVYDSTGKVIETIQGVKLSDILNSETGTLNTVFMNIPSGSQTQNTANIGQTGVKTGTVITMVGVENGLVDPQTAATTAVINLPGKTVTYTVQPTGVDGNSAAPVTETGQYGTAITAPDIPGYTADRTGLTVPASGTVTIAYMPTTQQVTVIPILADGTLIDIPEATNMIVEGETATTVSGPTLPGYQAGTVTIPATDKSMQIVYQPTIQTVTIIPINSDTKQAISTGGSISVSGPTGSSVKVPEIPGYESAATVTIGTGDASQTVAYTPKTVTATVTIPSNSGELTVDGVTGKTGELVDVTVPVKAGYTADHATVPAYVNTTGAITVIAGTIVTYTPTPGIDQDNIPGVNQNQSSVTGNGTGVATGGQTVATGTTRVSDNPSNLASVSGTVKPLGNSDQGIHQNKTAPANQSPTGSRLASTTPEPVSTLAPVSSQQAQTPVSGAETASAPSFAQNGETGELKTQTTHNQRKAAAKLPQTDDQQQPATAWGILGVIVSLFGLGAARKKHDVN